jgi:mitochondrial import inner membrane translocase subunit TIM44
MIESDPVLIVSFSAQQIIYVTDSKGDVVEGSKDKIKKVHHVWALTRNQTDLNPAWRLMECAMHETDMFV